MAIKGGSLKRKLSTFVSLKSKSVSQETSWIERYTPEAIDELAVHKKKISEVEAWFFSCSRKNESQKEAPMLLLTGPPGAGKTATVKTICRNLHAELFVWSNSQQEKAKKSQFYEDSLNINERKWMDRENQATSFNNFILRSTKYSLFSNCKRVVVVEEFPNAFLMDPSLFHSILRRYSVYGKCPVVFIVSDGIKSENIENRLFPKDLQFSLKISSISFNPVAPTMLIKVLNRINNSTKIETGFTKLTKTDLENISANSLGDIRQAINSMQFLCCSKSGGSKALFKNNQKAQSIAAENGCDGYSRDCPLFLFHALGKILYCKRDQSLKSEKDILPIHMKHFEKDPLIANPEDVYEKTAISAEGFALFLQENYLSFVMDIDLAANCSLWLSEADKISSYWNGQDTLSDYMFSLTARGLMFNLGTSTSGNRWRPLHKPQFYGNSVKVNNVKSALKRTFKEKSLYLRELQTEIVPFLAKLNTSSFTPEQTALTKELGEMNVKRTSRPLFFKPLSEKDVFEEETDTDNNEVNSMPLESIDLLNTDCNFSDEEYIIEEYDF